MTQVFRNIFPIFLILYFSFCGSEPAQGKEIPEEFGRDNFYEIIEYCVKHYIDPQAVNVDISYRSAAEYALKTLPFPLVLMSQKFHDNRKEIFEADRVVPGKIVEKNSSRGYLIFEPDYIALENINKAREKKDVELRKNITKSQRKKRFDELQKQMDKEQKFVEESWEQVSFSKKDFEYVVEWIEKNQKKYNKVPSTFTGEDPFKESPFGMHHVYFSAANGFLSAMDPHSSVIENRHWKKMLTESEDSSFEGIGAILRGGGTEDVVVETPLPGSPALNSGLRAGDVIRKVDNVSINAMPLSQVVKKIRGKKGTVVELFVERTIEMLSLPIRIKRDRIEIKAVSSEFLKKEKIGVIKIKSFLYNREPPSELIQQEYANLMKKSGGRLQGLVLDLRNNSGGDLDDAVNTTGLFLPKNAVVVKIKGRTYEEDRYGELPPLIDFANKSPSIPIVVLTNAGSASASEILASALMDHNVALVLGDRTFGKASVQGVQPRDGILIKLTTARYYAPKDYTIQVYGVVPDVSLSDEEDGGFSPHFREEDMWKHLPKLKQRPADPAREKWVEKLKQFVRLNDKAEAFLKKHKKDALKPDYMLVRSISYIQAMKTHPFP